MKIEHQILLILLLHWIADFLLQTEKMANNKSKNNYWLLTHVFVYSITWFFVGLFFFEPIKVIYFFIVTFVCHFITDYITSRLTTKLYNDKKYRTFFSVIGFDQFLHYTQLVLSYDYITNL